MQEAILYTLLLFAQEQTLESLLRLYFLSTILSLSLSLSLIFYMSHSLPLSFLILALLSSLECDVPVQ